MAGTLAAEERTQVMIYIILFLKIKINGSTTTHTTHTQEEQHTTAQEQQSLLQWLSRPPPLDTPPRAA